MGWEIHNVDTSSFFEAATSQISPCGFDSILTILCNDYGQPTYNHNTLPKELIPAIDTGTYWMSKKSYNQVYYWCSDTLNVSFGLFEKELINGKDYAYLYIVRPKSNGETKRWGGINYEHESFSQTTPNTAASYFHGIVGHRLH